MDRKLDRRKRERERKVEKFEECVNNIKKEGL